MSCVCQQCGKDYRVDLILPDHIWEIIKPNDKPVGSGLLCGPCIMSTIENTGDYTVFYAISGE